MADGLCHQMLTAGGVAPAVEHVRAGETIHTLIMDLHLADGSGFDVIRALAKQVLVPPMVLSPGTLNGVNAPGTSWT